jgi:hypothetical protein
MGKFSRSHIRRLLFAVRDNRINMLDRDDRGIAEEVYKEFNGYLLGSIGWPDFSFKWDLHPNISIEDLSLIDRVLTIKEWTEKIISLFEWKEWRNKLNECHKGKKIIPPPCFTRQEQVLNGR